jgi:hypothetical protein
MTPAKRRAVFLRSLFLKWAAVVAALGVCAVGILLLWGVVREPLFLKWAAVVAAPGVYAVGILLLWGVVRKPGFLKWAAVVVALGVYAVGIYLLWDVVVVREPLFLTWAAVVAALGVYAVGIYLLWDVVRKPVFLQWAAVVVALGVFAVGILLLWGVWDGTPVAAAFTRVGGATRVETALEASHFWLTPPQCIVMTDASAKQETLMFAAARYAMIHNAPLLFTPHGPKQKRLVHTTITAWQTDAKARYQKQPDMIRFKRLDDVTGHCQAKANPADVDGLSTLRVPNQPLPPPSVPRRDTLAPVVVFAAALEPANPPDVAVGMALAAHMTRAYRKVSLVVVPHYLESDPELEKKLQSQHELVTGGVVLGQTPTVPEDTRTLLRQLLTARDRHGVLGQLQDDLGSVGSLIAALLALVGLATTTWILVPIVIKQRKRTKERKRIKLLKGTATKVDTPRSKKVVSIFQGGNVPEKVSDWLDGLGKDRQVTVTVRLRSGREVTGIIESQFPTNTRDATGFRIKKELSVPSPPGPEGKYAYVLVSVKDIEQIYFNESEAVATKGQRGAGVT